MLKVNNKDTRMTPRMTPGVVLVSLLLTLNIFPPCSSVSIVNFEHVIAGWDINIWKSSSVKYKHNILCQQVASQFSNCF